MTLLIEKSKSLALHAVLINHVKKILHEHDGNRTRAAKDLGITARCLRNWISRFDDLSEFRKLGKR